MQNATTYGLVVIIADEELAILKSQIVTSSWAGTVFVLGGRDNKGMKSEIRNSKKGLFPRSREGFFLPQRRGDAERWPRRSAALQRLGDGALKRMGILLMTILLVGSVGWAEDEGSRRGDDFDDYVAAVYGGRGDFVRVGSTYVGSHDIITRVGNAYVSSRGIANRAGRTYISEDNRTVTRAGSALVGDGDIVSKVGGTYVGGQGIVTRAGSSLSKPESRR